MDSLTIGLTLGIVILVIFLSWIWPPDSPWAPWWRTNKKTARKAFELASVKRGETVYELGSGEATALIVAAKEFGARCIGIEIDPMRYSLSKFAILRNRLGEKVTLKRGNFFKEDLSEADVVFVYLVPKTLNRLIPKFKKELKKGTRIISFRYDMNLPLKKFDKSSDLRFYII